MAVSDELAVDETNLTPGPMIFNDTLNVNFGLDGPGTITPNDNVVISQSVLGGTLSSGGVPVVITSTPTGYVGMAGGATVFTLEVQNDGDYTFQLFDRLDHADATDPNDVIRIDFGVTIADSDGDTANGDISIFIHDDAPVAYDDGSQAVEESQSVSGNLLANDELSEDQPTELVRILMNGSETAVPSGGSATINGLYGTLVVNSDGTYTYTANNNDPEGTDEFTYVIRDYDGDEETAEFSFIVTKDDEPKLVDPADEMVDETNLGPITETGQLQADFGDDGPGTFMGTGDFNSSGSQTGGTLSHNGRTGDSEPGGRYLYRHRRRHDRLYVAGSLRWGLHLPASGEPRSCRRE